MIKNLTLPFPTVLIFSNDAIVCWDCLVHSFSFSSSKYSLPILTDLGKEGKWEKKEKEKEEEEEEEEEEWSKGGRR